MMVWRNGFMAASTVALVSLVGLTSSVDAAKPTAERVELFAAAQAEQVELKVIPKDATQATVLIKNKTNNLEIKQHSNNFFSSVLRPALM